MPNLKPEEYFAPFAQIIPDFAAFCNKLSDPLPVHLRMNSLKAPVRETRLRLEQQGFGLVKEDPLKMVFRAQNFSQPGHLLEFSLGHLHSQAFSSVMAAFVLGCKPNEAVLDLCAAPGSKTSLLAQLMENKGIIVANDSNPDRLIPLRANLKRLGVTNTLITRYPGQHFPKKFFFDRVLVDVPCSAEGTLRAGPNGTLRGSSRGASQELTKLQRHLLLTGFDLLKVGGTLVYSTCTYAPGENESAVQFLLKNRPAEIQPIAVDLPHSSGLRQWKEVSYDDSIKYCWRMYPHQIDTVGFFLARFVRRS
jgi:NOL1/NOP2/sun family putative RNA methylase